MPGQCLGRVPRAVTTFSTVFQGRALRARRASRRVTEVAELQALAETQQRNAPNPRGTPVVPGTALRWGGADAVRSRLGLRARRAPPASARPAAVSRGRASATTRSSTSGQHAEDDEHQGGQHPETCRRGGSRPRAPPCMAPVAPLFHPLPSYADAAGSSLHQRGGTPHPRVRAIRGPLEPVTSGSPRSSPDTSPGRSG